MNDSVRPGPSLSAREAARVRDAIAPARGSGSHRLVSLDLLRLTAIVLVLGRHLPAPPPKVDGAVRAFLSAWHRGGWVGVDLFFVLSGFLVSGLLFAEFRSRGTISPVRFYVRRGFKIYPPFFLLIAATPFLALMTRLPDNLLRLLPEVLFLQSYFRAYWPHTWSLAVEEHFYFLLPLLLLLVLRIRRGSSNPFRALLFVAPAIAFFCLAARISNLESAGVYNDITHLFPTHLRLDSLFFGVLISYLYHFHTDMFVAKLRPWRLPMGIAGLVMLVPAFILPIEETPFVFTLGLTVFYIGSGLLMVSVLLSGVEGKRLLVPLARVGSYSYSIYLWHVPLLFGFIPGFEQATGIHLGYWSRVTIYLAGSIAVGVALSRMIETPVLRLRDRWFPQRAEPARAGATANEALEVIPAS